MNKKLIFGMLLMFALLAFASFAEINISVPKNLKFGSDSQERDRTLIQSFVVNNTGDELVNVSISSNIASYYNITITPNEFKLSPGESKQVNVSAYIPLNLSSGYIDNDGIFQLYKNGMAIGNINVVASNGSNSTSRSIDVKMQAENKLYIRKVKVYYNNESETVDNGDKVSNLKPGYNVEIEVTAKNRFSDKEDDPDINDIVLYVTSEDLDVDEDTDISDLGPREYDSASVDFDIDIEQDDNTYPVTITVYGEDDNGALHGETWTIDLEVERERHDIVIDDFRVSPTFFSCLEKNELVKVSVDIRNAGRDNEDEVAVRVFADELGFDKKSELLELDRDDEDTVFFTIPIMKETEPGTYTIAAQTFYNEYKLSNSAVKEITIEACPKPENKTEEVIVKVEQQTNETEINKTETPVEEIKEKPFFESTAFLIILGAVILVVIIVIIFLMMRLY